MKLKTSRSLRIGLLLYSVTCILNIAGAQDVHFSQFYESAPMRNPGLTGIFSGDYKITMSYRNQWSSFATPFQTGMVAAETKAHIPSTGDFVSFGLVAMYDKAGQIDFASTSVYGAVNYNKALGLSHRTFLSGGLCGGFIQRSINPSKMRFANQFVGGAFSSDNASGENIGNTSIQHFDAAAGLSLSGTAGKSAAYYFGVGAYHVSQPSETYWGEALVRLTTRWSVNAGLSAPLGERMGVTVHLNYQRQEPYEEWIGGGMISYRGHTKGENEKPVAIAAGCFYRLNDAVIPTVKLDYRRWAATLSYDVAISSSRVNFGGVGGWELSTALRGSYRHKREITGCPHFDQLEEYPVYER